MNVYMIVLKVLIKPYLGQRFQTLDEGVRYYKEYAAFRNCHMNPKNQKLQPTDYGIHATPLPIVSRNSTLPLVAAAPVKPTVNARHKYALSTQLTLEETKSRVKRRTRNAERRSQICPPGHRRSPTSLSTAPVAGHQQWSEEN
nr:hypothetical protein Iba_chr09cCG14230 [Ipomoea batatas]GME17740.1 hypothetical protein Iba_scaffold19384CG0040 [Ipomoea batatas]